MKITIAPLVYYMYYIFYFHVSRQHRRCNVDRGFEPRSGQSKNYKIDICCVFAKHTALLRKKQILSGSESE